MKKTKSVMKHTGLFTSNKDDWRTPTPLFNKLNKRFSFDYDVCASHENAKCPKYFTKEMDGLKQQWTGTCYCNPPYGRVIGKWMEKAYKSSVMGATVVCLIPARTETRWYNNWVVRGEVEFLKGRQKFSDGKTGAPFPSAVVTFYGHMPSSGIFRDRDIIGEINLWGKNNLETMAPWLLPYRNLTAEQISEMVPSLF